MIAAEFHKAAKCVCLLYRWSHIRLKLLIKTSQTTVDFLYFDIWLTFKRQWKLIQLNLTSEFIRNRNNEIMNEAFCFGQLHSDNYKITIKNDIVAKAVVESNFFAINFMQLFSRYSIEE